MNLIFKKICTNLLSLFQCRDCKFYSKNCLREFDGIIDGVCSRGFYVYICVEDIVDCSSSFSIIFKTGIKL